MNWKYSIHDIVICDNKQHKILNYTRQGGVNLYLVVPLSNDNLDYKGFVKEDNLTSLKELRKDKINKIDKL